METQRQRVGRQAEEAAAQFLAAHGLQVMARNYRRRRGELDLVARDGEVLVIAEVRTRSSNRYGGAAASVVPAKQRRILHAAAQLLQANRELARLRVRFDVIVVHAPCAARPRIEWLRHAFA